MNTSELPPWLKTLRAEVDDWLRRLEAPGEAFGYRYALDGCVLEEDFLSTGNAFNDMKVTGLLTEERWAAFGDYFLAFQEPETGLFYDPRLEATFDVPEERREATAHNLRKVLTRGMLNNLPLTGRQPRYPIPGPVGEVYETREQVIAKLESLPWKEDPWGAGSHGAMVPFFLLQRYQRGETHYADLIITAIEWLLAQQDPATGLWGDPAAPMFQRLNGAYKVLMCFTNGWKIEPRYQPQIIDSVLGHYASGEHESAGCNEFDNFFLLAACLRYTDYRRAEAQRLVGERLRAIEPHRKPDGGFSYFPDRCITHVLDCRLIREPLPQSDLMGTGTFCAVVALGLEILGWSDILGWPRHEHEGQPLPEELRERLLERGIMAPPT